MQCAQMHFVEQGQGDGSLVHGHCACVGLYSLIPRLLCVGRQGPGTKLGWVNDGMYMR